MIVLFDGIKGGVEVREMDVPPRVGETVILKETHYEVVDVIWDMDKSEQQAVVELDY